MSAEGPNRRLINPPTEDRVQSDEEETDGNRQPFLKRVLLRNYRSIPECDVELKPFTLLVGPNGAGKSNFLDALRFTAEGLRTTLDQAVRERGGIRNVRRRSGGHPNHFEVTMGWILPTGRRATYGYTIGAKAEKSYHVKEEFCKIGAITAGEPLVEFKVEEGELTRGPDDLTAVIEPDRLYLTTVSGLPRFRPLYDAIVNMGFYNLNPDVIRRPQDPEGGEILRRDGSNLASVLKRLEKIDDGSINRIQKYLSKIVPNVTSVQSKDVGPMETVEFRQEVPGQEHPWRFLAAQMSDGTLRALGILVALHQRLAPSGQPASLIGIEEPEATIHPGAAEVLSDALIEATERVQVVATTHSPQLLDSRRIGPGSIIAVTSSEGASQIARTTEETRDILQERLYTAGELLEMGELVPDPDQVNRETTQLQLYEELSDERGAEEQ